MSNDKNSKSSLFNYQWNDVPDGKSKFDTQRSIHNDTISHKNSKSPLINLPRNDVDDGKSRFAQQSKAHYNQQCTDCYDDNAKTTVAQAAETYSFNDIIPADNAKRKRLKNTSDLSVSLFSDIPSLNILPNNPQINPRNASPPKDSALFLAEDFAKRYIITTVSDALHIYNGSFHQKISDDTASKFIFKCYKHIIGKAQKPLSMVNEVVGLLKLCASAALDEFPANENLVVFKNGTLELDTGQFRDNSPDDYASSALDIEFDPHRRDMPNIKNFLETIANGDEELFILLLQIIGFILSNDLRAKSFIYLEGVPNAGKSCFCDLIASFFSANGANKVTRIALQDLGGKFALGNLVNTKLNISEDLPDVALSPATVSRIKMLSDSNRLQAEAKYVQAFEFKPMCKFLFASNHPLRIKVYDEAFINRVVYVPFRYAIPEEKQDKHLIEKMRGELPALFNYAISAYLKLVENNYMWAGAERFKPEICVDDSGLSVDKEVMLKMFVDSCCEFEKGAVIATSELLNAYYQLCDENNCQPIVGDRFSRELMALLPDTVTRTKIGNKCRGFRGMRLKPYAPPNIFE